MVSSTSQVTSSQRQAVEPSQGEPAKPRNLWALRPERLLLGKGSDGRVYADENSKTGSPWAVKVLEDRVKAVREYGILEYLKGAPHTIKPKGIFFPPVSEGNEPSKPVELAMERNSGPNLIELYNSNHDKFGSRQFFIIARKGLEALVYYKSKGIIHGDIKLENCFYDLETDVFKIFDFANSYFITEGKPNPGSLIYSSPEMVLNEFPGFERDLWALGIMLFSIYTGTHLLYNNFEGELAENRQKFISLMGFHIGAPFYTALGIQMTREDTGSSENKLQTIFNDKYYEMIGMKCVRELPQTPPEYLRPWRERIEHAAQKKKEDPRPIIAFLGRIFTMKQDRITAESALRRFFPEFFERSQNPLKS